MAQAGKGSSPLQGDDNVQSRAGDALQRSGLLREDLQVGGPPALSLPQPVHLWRRLLQHGRLSCQVQGKHVLAFERPQALAVPLCCRNANWAKNNHLNEPVAGDIHDAGQ